MELAKAVVITRKVYRLIAFASATFLVPVGLIYFHSLSGASQSAWGMSWIAAALSSSLLMLVIGDQSVIEGRGLVLEAAKSRAVVALSKQLGILGALAAGFGIWAVAAGAAASLCTFYGLHSRGNNLINPTVRISMTELLAWIKRNWAFNWRISVSAISGFFIFQYMTLVIGIFQGFAAAGRIGLAIQMANAPLWFAAPMVSTRRYSWIAMIEHGNRRELDESWSGATRLACIATAIMSIGVFAALIIVQYFPDMAGKNIAQKLPSLTEMALLLLVTLINQYVFSIAQYLRCHGKEPFYAISAISALCLAVLMPIACSFGARSALSLYLILAIFSAIAGKVIFDRFRRGFVCHS